MAGADLHTLAVDAEKSLEALATGLGQAGADPQSVDAVSQMAEVTRKIVKALGAGQAHTGDDEPPAEPEAAPAKEQPAAEEGHTMDSATADLHQQMVASAHQRAKQGY